jgi:hypothetical protein
MLINLASKSLLALCLFAHGCGENAISREINESTVPMAFQFNGGVRGCGDFVVYRFTQDDTKAIGVRVDKLGLRITEKPQIFEIGKIDGIQVFIDDFGKETYEWRGSYCYDAVKPHEGQTERFEAIGGGARIYVSKSSESPFYEVTVHLENVSFTNESGSIRFLIPNIEIKNVLVGWLPG